MNVAKNWALTIMLIALAFAHFSSELLLKEQMIIPVKKNVQRNRLFFTDCFWANFPPEISREIVRFF